MKKVERTLIRNVIYSTTYPETKNSGNTGYNASTGMVTLHGNEIAKITRTSGNIFVEWVDLCGYPTPLTLSRLRSLGLMIRKEKGRVILEVLGKKFEAIERGRIPVLNIRDTILESRR